MAFGCHNCPHSAEIERLRETCLGCKRCNGERVKVGDWTHVSLDAASDEACAAKILSMVPPDYTPRQKRLSRVDVPDAVRPYLLRIIDHVKLLQDSDLLLLAAMLRGERLVDISRRTGDSLQTLHGRWKRILRRDPVWLAVANGMIGSGRGRKKKADGKDLKTNQAHDGCARYADML